MANVHVLFPSSSSSWCLSSLNLRDELVVVEVQVEPHLHPSFEIPAVLSTQDLYNDIGLNLEPPDAQFKHASAGSLQHLPACSRELGMKHTNVNRLSVC